MLPNLTRLPLVAAIALSLATVPAAPALAWGKNEQNFVKGAAAALIVGAIIHDATRRQQQQTYYVTPARPAHAPAYAPAPGRVVTSVYHTPVAQAFNSFGPADRRVIQKRLAAYGYYRGGIDGAFGPGTYSAVLAYARDTGQAQGLSNRSGAYGIYDSLIY